jgi:hypothetical protein
MGAAPGAMPEHEAFRKRSFDALELAVLLDMRLSRQSDSRTAEYGFLGPVMWKDECRKLGAFPSRPKMAKNNEFHAE